MVQPSCPVTDRKMGGVGVGEQREELSRPAEQEWPWKEDRRPEGEVAAKGLPYQVLGHGLGPDVEGEAAELRRVLKFTIKVPKSIGRISSLEKAGLKSIMTKSSWVWPLLPSLEPSEFYLNQSVLSPLSKSPLSLKKESALSPKEKVGTFLFLSGYKL